MNGQTLRSALVALNVLLILCVVALGGITFFGPAPAPPAWPANDGEVLDMAKRLTIVPPYNPVRLALPHQRPPSDPLAQYAIIWQSLEKPPPPPPPPKPIEQTNVPTQTAVEQLFSLVMVHMHPKDPSQNSCILQPRQGGEQIVVHVGEKVPNWPAYTCASIDRRLDGGTQVCVLTLVDEQKRPNPVVLRPAKD